MVATRTRKDDLCVWGDEAPIHSEKDEVVASHADFKDKNSERDESRFGDESPTVK